MFDNTILLNFLQDFDDNKHQKIINAYRSSMKNHMEHCKNAIEKNDPMLLRNATHDIKSTALMIGYVALGELANKIECDVIENREEQAFSSTPALFPHFKILLDVLENAAQEKE